MVDNASKEEQIQKLSYRKKQKYYQYYINGKYISRQKEMGKISNIAKNEYREKLLPILDKQIGYLKKVLKTENSMSNVYNRMSDGKKRLFVPDYVTIDDMIKEFEKISYNGLEFSKDDRTEFFTNKGERVRSKSEKIIADELFRYKIPYKYEMPLEMVVNGKKKEFYPDFTAMNKNTGEIRYIEHFGMMDNPQYYRNVLAKLDVYERNGFLVGREVIIFHESTYQPLNTRVISDYIKEFLI